MSRGATHVEMEAGAAIQSLMKIIPALAFQPYMTLLRLGALDREEVARAIDADAEMIERMTLPECFIGVCIAEDLREYAEAVRGKASPAFTVVGHAADSPSRTDR